MAKIPCYYLFAFAVLLTLLPCQAKTSTNLTTDQSALLSLKALPTSDPYQILTRNWTNSSDVCSWIGVTCGLRHRRVTALNISNMGLSGTIPPQLGSLSFLVSLDLRYNHFSGILPQELSLLHRLKFISLDVNNFTGDIPPLFGLLSKLEYLSLENNSFIGFIPNSLSNLSNLRVLDFGFNYLNGEIPEELGRLDNLQFLGMYFNHLSGGIPSAIFNISTLQTIDLGSNELSGSLPSNMCNNLPLLETIRLSDNQLSGQIPSNLSECRQLEIMSLSYNSFSGEIPVAIGKLKSLQVLYLGGNKLNGVIPMEVGNLQNLVELAIEDSNISGTLPLNIYNLSSLQFLGLWRNNLSGSISRDIANLTTLKDLELGENNFIGVLPPEISQLYQLGILYLDTNSLSGSIPTELFNISTLQFLSLNRNGMSGGLPTSLCYGSSLLQELYLDYNNLSGAIPTSISNCAHLTYLNLSGNKFTGVLPHFLGNLTLLQVLILESNNLRIDSSSSELSFITSLTNCRHLTELAIVGNPLNGTIPISIGNLSSSLQNIFASNCEIKGTIPADIGNLSNLIQLSLYGNKLSGNIPNTLKHLHKLQGLYLHRNKIEGPIVEGLCHLQSISDISLSQNKLSGRIPDCFGNVTSLRKLFLNSNKLTSTIPTSFWRLTDLLLLDLSENSISGFLPSEMGNLKATIYINLSMNQFSESIPSNIGKLQNLINLSLAHNKLEGSIPESIGSMISLITLDLSFNNLFGPIPKSFEKLQYLEYFNISFNALSGEIPSNGPFKNFTMESFKANKALCGIPMFHVPPCGIVTKPISRRKKVEFTLFIIAGLVVLVTVVSLALIFVRYKKKDKVVGRTDEQMGSAMLERISYYEILKSTEQFNESNLLGIGSFGSVYRGVLRDGKVIAVKVFNLQTEAAFRSFDIECNVLRNIRHRNLTKVISSCSNKDFRALVLEYMPMGNLEKWLYSHNHCLNVMQRLDIMTDVACALEYLHHGYSTPIVHCDLKPSNVLLDKEMVAHISDFGISKLLGEGDSVVVTNTLATLGYIAPEYGLEGLVSTRCDVYSYGIMLLEIFTRKRPSHDMFGGDLSLKSWVERLVPQSLEQVIDVNLLTNLDDENCEKMMHCVFSILVLALKCLVESPADRINMKETVSELQKIKRQFYLLDLKNTVAHRHPVK
ncbi:hypothetical protein ACS0TY_018980 [Phlomoides rotata]